jgi:hypothetical protein
MGWVPTVIGSAPAEIVITHPGAHSEQANKLLAYRSVGLGIAASSAFAATFAIVAI